MAKLKSVKIDGESIYIFNSAIYIFQSTAGSTLELTMIVSEIVLNKYGQEENLILEIELQDGGVINAIMHPQRLPDVLPQLHLYCEIDDIEEYGNINIVHENDSFPKIEEGITIQDIRKVEMPDEKLVLKLKLPIDQAEWLRSHKATLNEILKEAIYDYWRKREGEDT
ncbi:hypothetical protein [Bacillus sp. V59.32b]|uniref:hypothetical protein n=1 Tax=Bacillus sp. V59.32b TaxID=1758642 RepID=UPI000E3D1396|nr:hypothetical protein [Bacillus sp. V59.32b]RFU68381.1 hypothetical protein D0463_04995 [Bacillus sp. V59.32b]